MLKIDTVLLAIISELFVNLAAGWFATVFIVPNLAGLSSPLNWLILTANIGAGIVSLLIAFKLRKTAKKGK